MVLRDETMSRDVVAARDVAVLHAHRPLNLAGRRSAPFKRGSVTLRNSVKRSGYRHKSRDAVDQSHVVYGPRLQYEVRGGGKKHLQTSPPFRLLSFSSRDSAAYAHLRQISAGPNLSNFTLNIYIYMCVCYLFKLKLDAYSYYYENFAFTNRLHGRH